MVEPSQGSCDLLGLYNGDFVRDGIALYDTDSITKEFITILDELVLDVECVTGTIYILVLIDIDAVVLDVGEINRINRTLTDYLGGNPRGAAGAAHKENE